MAKMIGSITGTQGCCFGKGCTCNSWYRGAKMKRVYKRRERQAWKKEAGRLYP